jgi:hypothetical protein
MEREEIDYSEDSRLSILFLIPGTGAGESAKIRPALVPSPFLQIRHFSETLSRAKLGLLGFRAPSRKSGSFYHLMLIFVNRLFA